MEPHNVKKLFLMLYKAKNEEDVEGIILNHFLFFGPANWRPLGNMENNFGIVENQQSNPVAAIVEKLTNSIDAILMRKCLEANIDPRTTSAPRSIEEAIVQFFPDHKNWDLSKPRNEQAREIQILADSYPNDTANTSLIIYDNGEGQHPRDFENSFLSLLRGNKNEIHFVQGKYNMGGSGAIVFCGKKRYQLIGSRKFDKTGNFGFTLIRRHPLTDEEAKVKKSTWYEYLKIDDQIPSFPIETLDLGLYQRQFQTGTIIKLYSYELKGNRHIRRDLSRSLNEFLYAPALPIYVIENELRYPNDNVLTLTIFGLKHKLGNDDYIEKSFSDEYFDQEIGQMKVTVYVFKSRVKDKTPEQTKKFIQEEFFKNNMAVIFSVNGQVHGHYSSEFITRSLKYNLLRDYLLIHVDCTNMKSQFRSELFMASRDRLKQGNEASILRQRLTENLKSSELKDIYKQRKDRLSVENADNDELIKSFAENLPLNSEMHHLLSQAFKLDSQPPTITERKKPPANLPKEKIPFNPKRFPSFFKLEGKSKNEGIRIISIPLNGEKTLKFNSDVENAYFHRIDEPGELQIAIMGYKPNGTTGGNKKGTVNTIEDVFNVNKKSPNEGTIKVILNATDNINVGDEITIKVDLTSPGQVFTEVLTVKISEPLPEKTEQIQVPHEEKIGLPKHVLVYEHQIEGVERTTWATLAEAKTISWDTIIYPQLEGDILEVIYINMDSRVLKNYKSKIRNITQEKSLLADNRYISSVYFHTLFLYVINKNRHYIISKEENGQEKEVDLGDYLMDLFTNQYAAFLLNFGISELMDTLD